MMHHYPAEETAIHHHRVSTFVTRSLGLGVLFFLASGCRRLFHDHQRLYMVNHNSRHNRRVERELAGLLHALPALAMVALGS